MIRLTWRRGNKCAADRLAQILVSTAESRIVMTVNPRLLPPHKAAFVRMVTNSSAAVGWIPMVSSN
jgi:hypothetical protein